MSTPAPRPIGFVGKLPTRPDFVRHNIGERIGAELDRWLVSSSQTLQHARAGFPAGTLRFVFSATGCDSIAIGALLQSSDRVGRAFPLAIFGSLPLSDAAPHFSALPHACRPFLGAAAELLARSGEMTPEELVDAVLALPPPSAADLAASSAAIAGRLASTRATDLLAQLYAAEAAPSVAYGLSTLCTATASLRAAPAPGPSTVLDCPLGSAGEAGLDAWLELVRRRLGSSQLCPSYVWTDHPRPRLLIALGFASDQLLHFVADPKHRGARLWPLLSDRPDALARARSALAPQLEANPDASAAELWQVLGALQV